MHLGGFSIAAQKIGATQPAISARIKELERAIGTSLFERDSKSLKPSASARALFPLVAEVLAGVARIEGEISKAEIVRGSVRIGVGEIVALTWFPAFLAHINSTYPSVQLDIHMDVTNTLMRMLEEGRIDLAFVPSPGAGHFHSESLGTIPHKWMASKSLVSAKHNLTPAQLAQLPIYSLHRNSKLHSRTLKWFRERGARPDIVHGCNSMSLIIKIIEMGRGIALLPPILVRKELQRGSIRIIPTQETDLATEFFLVRHPEIIDPTILRISEIALKETGFLDS